MVIKINTACTRYHTHNDEMLQTGIATAWPKIWANSMNKIAVLMKVHKLTSGSMRNMLEKGAQDALPDESFPFDIYGNYVEPVTLPDKNVHDGTSTEPPKMTNNESHHI